MSLPMKYKSKWIAVATQNMNSSCFPKINSSPENIKNYK